MRQLFLLVLILLLTSCAKQSKQAPPLERDRMAGLMMEIYLAEARASLLPIPKDSSYHLFLVYQDSLMRKRGIADSTLKKAYSYYLEHPAELEAVYDAIIDSLTLREQRGR